MKVRDILELTDGNTMVAIHVNLMGMKFTTEHYPEYYFDIECTTVLEMVVKDIRVFDDKLHLYLL